MTVPPDLSLLDALQHQRPAASRSDLRRLLADGRVTLNDAVVKVAKQPVTARDTVRILPVKQPAIKWPFTIVHADDDLLVIDKPAGLLTSSVPREKRPTALAITREWAARERPRAKVGLVHRLDADASGLLCFSLNNLAHAELKRQFADHSAGRTYAAIVTAAVDPPAGMIRSLLVEHVDGTVHDTPSPKHGDSAVTHYQTTRVAAGHTLLHVTLETGRKHQIRSHLSSRGWPILGDRLYGGVTENRLMLAAVRLALAHPFDGQAVVFEAPLPPPFERAMRVT